MERTMPVVDVCLVCASEQKLRADLEAISSTAAGADSMVTELRDNLAALREGLAGLVEKWKRLGPDAWLGCIEQGQKKCAAELSNFLIQKGER
jgi:hypothetical protein